MGKHRTKPEKPVTPHKWTKEEFIQKYNELVSQSGWQIVYRPIWIQSMDTKDWRTMIATDAMQVPKDG